MDKIINVIPLVRIGEVDFGTDRSNVRKSFGEYKEFRKSPLSKNTSDDFGFCHVYYDDKDRCQAIELFSGSQAKVNGTIVFPGDITEVTNVLGTLESVNGLYIDPQKSIGIYAPSGKIESILFGTANYYAGG